MVKFQEWLGQRKALNFFFVFAYVIIIIFMHDPMVNLSVFVMNYFTRQIYDIIIGTLAFIMLMVLIFFFVRKLIEFPHARELKISYFLMLTSLIFVHSQVSFVMNIELIHAVEFGLLALLLFPLVKKFGDTAFYTLLLAFVDEWFQYQILYPDKSDYFDFNDMVTNLLGAGFALIMLYAAGINNRSYPAQVKWFQSPLTYIAAIVLGVVTVLLKCSLLQVYKGEGAYWLVLNKAEGPESFWRNLTGSEIVYHVMQPIEGVIVLVLLLIFLFGLDYFAQKSIHCQMDSPEQRRTPCYTPAR